MASRNTAFNLTLKVNGDEVKNTMNGVGKELRKLRAQTRNLTEGTDKWVEKNQALAQVEKRYDDMKKAQRKLLNETKKNISASESQNAALNEFGQSVTKVFSSLRRGDLVGVREGFDGIKKGIRGATRAALKFIATPIGATITALVGIGIAAKKLWDYNAAMDELNEQLRSLGVASENMAKLRSEISATAETYKKDFKEIAESVKGLSSAFDISMSESNNIIALGLAKGGEYNKKFLSTIQQYQSEYENAGYSAKEFIDIVNQGYKLGLNADNLPRSIQRATRKLREQSSALKDALVDSFGTAFSEDLLERINLGETSVKDALNEIAVAAQNANLSQRQQANLTAQVFQIAGKRTGGAMKIFKALASDANEELDETIQIQEDLRKSSEELHKAQSRLFEVGGLADVWDHIKTAANSAFALILNSFADLFASIDKLKEEAAGKGQANAIEMVSDNVKKLGTTAKEEAAILMNAAEKNVDRLQKKLDNLSFWKNDTPYKKKLAEAKSYYKELSKIAEEGLPDTSTGSSQNGDSKKTTVEKKKEVERKAAAKKRLAQEEANQKALDSLDREYTQKKEDRLADSAEKQAKLEKERALKKAESLQASNEIIDKIKKEHDIKIKEAREEDEEKELENMRDFEDRKRELENELELERAESDQEKKELKEEQRYEKELTELERLKLSTEEKNQIIELSEEIHQTRLKEIEKKANEERLKENKKFYDNLIKSENNLHQAKSDAYATGINALLQFMEESSGAYKALFLLEKGLAASEIITNAAKGIATAQANLAAVPPVIGAIPNPMYPVAVATTAKNVLATKISAAVQLASIASQTVKGFADGGYTDMFGTRNIDHTGHEVAGVVHTNEYVVPEVVRQDPEVPQILDYLENKRRKKLGLYADGGDTKNSAYEKKDYSVFTGTDNTELISAIEQLILVFQNGINANIFWGYDAELKRREVAKKIDQIQTKSSVKKKSNG